MVDDPDEPGQRKALHFQEWWVRYRAKLPAHSIVPIGAEEAQPAPGVLSAIEEADAVLFAPSNPVVSVGTVLSVPGVREALRRTKAGVVGVSPIIGDKPLRGMADACLKAIGDDTSAEEAEAADEAKDYGEGSFRGTEPPTGFAIKGNEDSMKFHTPESRYYGSTIAEVWFDSTAAAEAAGYTNAVREQNEEDAK